MKYINDARYYYLPLNVVSPASYITATYLFILFYSFVFDRRQQSGARPRYEHIVTANVFSDCFNKGQMDILFKHYKVHKLNTPY
jgi:hypothetical protein